MKSTLILKHFSIIFFSWICFNLAAQPGFSFYTEAGRNNVSNGIFIKSAMLAYYKSGKNMLETGFQTDLKNNKFGFSGYTLSASRKLKIKDISLELKGFCTWTYPSEILEETNWGTLLKMRKKHFEMTLGTNFRSYNLRQKAIKDFEINSENTKVTEIYNIMYSISYYLKPSDDSWNIGLSITNFDHFIINQETNPVFNLTGLYRISSPVCLYIQAWYKCAGVTNLELNHFGFFFRTGITWNIN